MKKCNHCDREIMNDAKFCQFCGAKVPEELENKQPSYSNHITEDAQLKPDIVANRYTSNSAPTVIPPNKALVWLIVSSILTFLGCFCYGVGLVQIPTIITSAIATSKHSRGDYDGSERLAKVSMILFFSLLALFIVIVIIMFVVFFNLIGIAGIPDIIDEFY